MSDEEQKDPSILAAEMMAKIMMPDTSRLKALSPLKGIIHFDEKNWTWSMPAEPDLKTNDHGQ